MVQQRVRLKKEERMAADIINTSAPLQHVRVLHLGVAWVGRVTSMLLADQGADVVEVLRPGHEPHACDPLLGRGKRLWLFRIVTLLSIAPLSEYQSMKVLFFQWIVDTIFQGIESCKVNMQA